MTGYPGHLHYWASPLTYTHGHAVSIQTRLRDVWGYAWVIVDGWFGSQTDAATRLFQQRAGVVVDGIVGPASWGAL